MKLSLKRWFARSMTGGVDFVGPPAPPSRSAVRKATFITLAGVLAIVGALTGGYYFAMRPVPLKIAVGPPNSDDVKVVQALTQAFNQNHSYVRLRPLQTEGAATRQGQRQEDRAEDHQDRAIVRPQDRRGGPHAGQHQPAQGDPAAIW